MIRSELVQKIAEDNPALNVADAERIVTTIFDEIISSISSGNRVELRRQSFTSACDTFKRMWGRSQLLDLCR